jgi:hypothetical protein
MERRRLYEGDWSMIDRVPRPADTPAYDQYAFKNFCERVWDRIISNLIKAKAEQYTHAHNAFENFEDYTKVWDSTVPYEMLQMATKHWVFLTRYAKVTMNGTLPERMHDKARESAWDMIVYMLLFLFWLQVNELAQSTEEE